MTDQERFMKEAIRQAKKARALEEVPIGCVIVHEGKIIARGYNRRNTDKNTLSHAELNAILNSGGHNLAGSRIYVALFPCNECAKAIIQCGIKEVVYMSDKYADTQGTIASKRMLSSAGVKLTKFEPTHKRIEISFDESDV